MAIEIARSNEVPAALGGAGASRGRSGSSDGANSFASALASADREPNADALAASRPARSNDAANRNNSNGNGNGEQSGVGSTASNAADASAAQPANVAASSSSDDRDGDRHDAAASTATDTASNAAPNTSPVSISPADTSALLLAQSNLTAVSASSALDAAIAATNSAVAAAHPQDALAAQNMTTQRTATPNAAVPGTVKGTGTVDSHSAALGVALLDRSGGKRGSPNDAGRAPPTQDPAALARTPLASAASAAVAATAATGAVAAADAAAANRAAVSASAAPAADSITLAQAVAAGTLGEGASPWRRIERPADTATPSAGAASFGFDATGNASSSSATTDAAAAAANAGTGNTEFMERMVDQVSWWMAHRSQGAELKLDLPGGQPVSVSVQVQGNEAQVAFRSDHPEARQWLNAAMPQLKEMLGNEGLMLSGSSVGQSGTGAEREAARDAQRAVHAEGGRVTGTAASATDTTMSAAARPRSVTERALDLYV